MFDTIDYIVCLYIALESHIKYIDPNRKAVSYISDLYPAITETYDLVIHSSQCISVIQTSKS